MSIDIISMLPNRGGGFENEVATFRTRMRSLKFEAYLNTIYKPANPALVSQVATALAFPDVLTGFFSACNGARLFFDSFRVYGCLPQEYQRDRTTPLSLPPFSIAEVNAEFRREVQPRNMIVVGSYGYDRSLVCIDRGNERVICHEGEDLSTVRCSWRGLEQWLEDEIQRLGFLFDEKGGCLVPHQMLLPVVDRTQ